MGLFSFLSRNKKSKKIKAYSITNCGLVRKANEDNFYSAGFVPSEKNLDTKKNFISKYEKNKYIYEVFAVFDGMGGMNAGEIASGTAANELKNKLNNIGEISELNDLVKEVQNYTSEINEHIYNKAAENMDYSGMGTTFVCVCIFDDKAVVLNTGDSRCYVYDQGVLEILSIDHTIAAEHLRNNIITYEEAKKSKDNNKLTRFLGMSPEHGHMVNVVSNVIAIEKGTRFVLCSDGLYGMVEDEDILRIMKKGSISDCAEKLIKEAIINGGKDNVTVTVIEFI